MSKRKPRGEGRAGPERDRTDALGLEVDYQSQIAEYIHRLKFKKKVFGGVDQADVFRKLEELNRLYESLLLQERAKWQAELEKAMSSGQELDKAKSAGHELEKANPARQKPEKSRLEKAELDGDNGQARRSGGDGHE